MQGAEAALKLMALPEPTFKVDLKSLKDQAALLKSHYEKPAPAWLRGESERLRQERTAFRQTLTGQTSQAAARLWLAFVEKHQLQIDSVRKRVGKYVLANEEFVPFGWQIEILPGPDSWPELMTLVARRPLASSLRLQRRECMLRLLVAVLNNRPAALLPELKKLRSGTEETEMLGHVEEAFVKVYAEPDLVAAIFQTMLDKERRDTSPSSDRELLISIPKLLPTLDRSRAAGLLRQLLAIPASSFSPLWENYNDPPTRFLASEVALAMGDQLRVPAWELVQADDPTCIPLFELLKRRFPTTAYNYKDAATEYQKRLHPERPSEWDAKPSPAAKLLAEDRIEEAIPLLRAEAGGKAGHLLLSLGKVLQRPELVESGLKSLTQVTDAYRVKDAATLLIQHGHFDRAEALLFTQLRQRWSRYAARRKDIPIPDSDGFRHTQETNPTQDTVPLLFELYVRAGRLRDALLLLDEAPLWSNSDVAGEIEWAGIKSDGRYGDRDDFGFVVACVRVLIFAGRRAEALQVLQAGLLRQPSFMPLYELLPTLMSPEQTLAFLDRLRTGHPLVAQPLIGKAQLWQRLGRLADAELALRKVIALDPWQADWPEEERRKAHALLADLLEKQKRETEAAPYRQAVAAARAEEEIALLQSTGLTQRAIRAGEAALEKFPREVGLMVALMGLLVKQSRVSEAQTILQRVLERLAEGWGPNALPFRYPGRELFGSPALQSTAESTLVALLVRSPKSAPLHYLLALLRREQSRHSEALTALVQAATPTPDFLAAWRELVSEGENYGPLEAQRAALQILRLAPLGDSLGGEERYPSSPVADLAALWHLWTVVPHDLHLLDKSFVPFPGVAKEQKRLARARAEALRNTPTPRFEDQQARPVPKKETLTESDPRTALLRADHVSAVLNLAYWED